MFLVISELNLLVCKLEVINIDCSLGLFGIVINKRY